MAFTKLENNKTIKFYIKSTDTKPTSLDIPADKLAQLFEVDTGSTYYWLDNAWVQSYSGGSGGESDVSTAILTKTGNLPVPFIGPMCTTDGGEIFACISYDGDISNGEYIIPLYKGKAYVRFQNYNVNVSGDIEPFEGGYFITGDCTVEYSGEN